ncbi:MAG TPA: hypothetical protein VLL52_02540 [Anaerolineae bacterium]|nr:hypothetical protein [Anaerolineae bacterium]
MRRVLGLVMVFGLMGLACRGFVREDGVATVVPPATVPVAAMPLPTATVVVESTATAVVAVDVTAVPTAVIDPNQPIVWPTPISLAGALAVVPADEAQRETRARLQGAAGVPPQRDDVALAAVYLGLSGEVVDKPPVTEPLAVGTEATINVLNHDDNTMTAVPMVMKWASEHAYFWFDEGPGSYDPTERELEQTGREFDVIYEQVVSIFGSEANPGVDGDPRIHVMNVSPVILCNVSTSNLYGCGLAGYFSAEDTLPRSAVPHSNEREMFVMNGINFDASFYLSVLGHEFRHMVENRYDQGDLDWEVEGSAVLAQDLLGFDSSVLGRANQFLENPDQQLTNWADSGTSARYGQGYLFNRYLYDQLGADLYREFGQSALPGFVALDALAEENGLGVTGEGMWRDWLVALAVHTLPTAPAIYDFDSAVNRVAMERVDEFPADIIDDVAQYGADYYELDGSGEVLLTFTGTTVVPIFPEAPPSGREFWYAERANYSQMRLMRSFDLTGVTAATLLYDVYVDIEYGYDFAYVMVSADGGETWQAVVAEGMAGLLAADNPSERALAARFYTGQGLGWRSEEVDLTPWAGQEIWVRFEYVTDPILTYGGWGLDNIAVPEIGFADDGSGTVGGWTAEGFSPVTAQMEQPWVVQVVTFPGSELVVEQVEIDEYGVGSVVIDLDGSRQPPIVMVAAAAPLTLERVWYQLKVE